MKIFGRKWDGNDSVGKQYIPDYNWVGKFKVLLYDQDQRDFYFICFLCKQPFGHWLCADSVWLRLPDELHSKVLCIDCVNAVRKLKKLCY